MLTLAQMASFITGKIGQYDSTAIALCKQYLGARYQMVWDNFFWRDSQTTATVTLLAGATTIQLPMERMVTLRGPNGLLDPVDETFLIETDPTMVDTAVGPPQYYSEITQPPSGPTPTKYMARIYPTPDINYSIYVFGKRACPGFSGDTDVSQLRNCDNAIIAYAMGDMLERLRQYAKAQAKFTEAQSLLEEAKAVETAQANRPRRNKNLTVVGNSLLEMTDAVCAICNSWTPDIRILAKEFLRRNYISLYDVNLWPETTVVVKMPVTCEQMILPHYIDRVLAVRSPDSLMMMPTEIQWHFAVQPEVFESSGTPYYFTTLTPVGVGVLPASNPEALSIASSSPLDRLQRVFIRGESNGTEVTEEVVLNDPATTAVVTQYSYNVVLTVSKNVTIGDLTINGASSMVLLELIPAAERERKHQRIWVLPPPTVVDGSTSCLVLGKRKVTPLRSDQDTPIITGCQTVLISAAAADLFTRLGNAQDSATYRTRAEQAARVLQSINTDQAASSPKIVPVIEPSPLGVFGSDTVWSKV